MNKTSSAPIMLTTNVVPSILQQSHMSSSSMSFSSMNVGPSFHLSNTSKLAQGERDRFLSVGSKSQVLGLEVNGANSTNTSLSSLLSLLQQSGQFAPQVWQSMSSYHSVSPALLDSSSKPAAHSFFTGSVYDLSIAKQRNHPYIGATGSFMENAQTTFGGAPAHHEVLAGSDLPSLSSDDKTSLAVKMARAREKQGRKWMKEASQKQKPPGLSNTGQGNQVVAFRYFLEEEQNKGVVRIKALNALQTEQDLCDQRNPLGLEEWEVKDVDQWWTDGEASVMLLLLLTSCSQCKLGSKTILISSTCAPSS